MKQPLPAPEGIVPTGWRRLLRPAAKSIAYRLAMTALPDLATLNPQDKSVQAQGQIAAGKVIVAGIIYLVRRDSRSLKKVWQRPVVFLPQINSVHEAGALSSKGW